MACIKYTSLRLVDTLGHRSTETIKYSKENSIRVDMLIVSLQEVVVSLLNIKKLNSVDWHLKNLLVSELLCCHS